MSIVLPPCNKRCVLIGFLFFTIFFILALMVFVSRLTSRNEAGELQHKSAVLARGDMQRWGSKPEAAARVAGLALRGNLVEAVKLTYDVSKHNAQPEWKRVNNYRPSNDKYDDYADNSNASSSSPSSSSPLEWKCLSSCCYSSVSQELEIQKQLVLRPPAISMWNLKTLLAESSLYGTAPLRRLGRQDDTKRVVPLFDRRILPCLQHGTVLWVDTESIRIFAYDTLPLITVPFVLVTGDSDEEADWPRLGLTILGNKNVLRWYATNPSPWPSAAWRSEQDLTASGASRDHVALRRLLREKFSALPLGSTWFLANQTGPVLMERAAREDASLSSVVAANITSSDDSNISRGSGSGSSGNSSGSFVAVGMSTGHHFFVSFGISHEERAVVWRHLCPATERRGAALGDVPFQSFVERSKNTREQVVRTCGYVSGGNLSEVADRIPLRCSVFGVFRETFDEQRQQPQIRGTSSALSSSYSSSSSCVAFVASPRGNGIDCFRTYEALMLGAVPVLRRLSQPLDEVLEPFSVMVDSWRDVNATSLAEIHAPRMLAAARNRTLMKALHDLLSAVAWRSKMRQFRDDPTRRFLYRRRI